ncbi:TPA: hypothetical protein NG611_002979 [Vibrio parahaemolyticus]|nr:hypothetical protein [Vibrio parahaemolyticus]HCE3432325.1 hypothetical protein [Vibrio parahaemolyticus]HCG7276795.1 hypothetical protein [Vibrio parahaemolyticus]HCM0732440.1 hypothetical protein [Vibrio parahaemolyticus]
MSTSVSSVVDSMSQVSIPEDILNKVDINELLRGFSNDYKKLDDLKNTRERHENRNFVSRWWNNDELEDAQLDAAELQASFSKKLGQLMVISVAQSQQLSQQQRGLSEQQQSIKWQTEQLEKNAQSIKEQQSNLFDQNQKLENLVKEYFALKGLTLDGAKKLIDIAEQVKQTKAALIRDFDDRMEDIHLVQREISEEHQQFFNQQKNQLEAFKEDNRQKMDSCLQEANEANQQVQLRIVQSEESLQKSLVTSEERINESLSKVTEQQKHLLSELEHTWQADKTKMIQSAEEFRQIWNQKLQKQNETIAELKTKNDDLNNSLSLQEVQHASNIDELKHLWESVKDEMEDKELNWHKSWKRVIGTFSSVFIILAAALGYMAYGLYLS